MVFENEVLCRIFGLKTEDWKKSHDEDLYNLYSTSNIVMVIKPGRMRWVEHAACM
jgi:hypothetical protein